LIFGLIALHSFSTDWSLLSVLETRQTLIPSLASYLQKAAPIPSDAPVTTAHELAPYLFWKLYFLLHVCFHMKWMKDQVKKKSLNAPIATAIVQIH